MMSAACLGVPARKRESPTTGGRGGAEIINAWQCPHHHLEDAVPIALLPAASARVDRALVDTWEARADRLSQVTPGAKDGPAWMPAITEPGPRTGERVQAVSALVLDVKAAAVREPDCNKTVTSSEPPPFEGLSADLDHHYFTRKRILPRTAHRMGEALVLLVMDLDGRIHSPWMVTNVLREARKTTPELEFRGPPGSRTTAAMCGTLMTR